MYYVYLHRKKTDGSVFYVGKGKERRAYWKNQRNKHWHAVVNKHGYEIEIYRDGMTEEEAFDLEKKLIEHFGMENLCNYTNGGDGASGAIRSESFKEIMREKMRGRVFHPDTIQRMREAAKMRPIEHREKQAKKVRGRKHTEEHKRKIAESCTGRVLSEEARKKVSDFHKGKKKKPEAVAAMAASKSKKVFCENNGKTYPSCSEAARELGLSQSKISDVARGIAKSTKGYTFKGVDDEAL